MKRTNTLIAFVFAASALTLNAHAGDINANLYGAPAAAAAAQRSVDITPDTRHVKVTNGETVTFNIHGKPFTWTFQLYQQEGALALSAILPDELRADGVTVYVASNPIYR
jgi:hypothetical protein